jgi:hypothetical protein
MSANAIENPPGVQETPIAKVGPKQGVFYPAADYAGIGPRIAILVIDSVALLLILGITALVCSLVPSVLRAYGILAIMIIWLYEVPLKRSSFGTLAS